MLLAVDIGNTNVVFGLFEQDTLVLDARAASEVSKTSCEWAVFFSGILRLKGVEPSSISRVVICSVVPPISRTISNMSRELLKIEPLLIAPGVKTGMPILYENPKEVGADRVVNAVAAVNLYGRPVIVVDFGTAVTFDAIDHRGRYLGGAILPGLVVAAQALFSRTSKLPMVDISKPPSVIGRNTVDAINAGLYYGYVSLVQGMVKRFKEVLGEDTKVIATGGQASMICRECPCVDAIDPMLTLKGLKILADMNPDG